MREERRVHLRDAWGEVVQPAFPALLAVPIGHKLGHCTPVARARRVNCLPQDCILFGRPRARGLAALARRLGAARSDSSWRRLWAVGCGAPTTLAHPAVRCRHGARQFTIGVDKNRVVIYKVLLPSIQVAGRGPRGPFGLFRDVHRRPLGRLRPAPARFCLGYLHHQ